MAETRDTANKAFAQCVKRCHAKYPKAMACRVGHADSEPDWIGVCHGASEDGKDEKRWPSQDNTDDGLEADGNVAAGEATSYWQMSSRE